MFVSENLAVNQNGNLTIGGVDTVELAKNYGTPLYVMDEQMIRKNLRRFHESMQKFYDGKGLVCYASKAFSCMEMCRIVASEGDGLDVVSVGELYTADISTEHFRIMLHHPGHNRNQLVEKLPEDRAVRPVSPVPG